MVTLRFLFFIIFFSVPSFAQHIFVEASADTTDYMIGDRINYSLTVTTGKNVYPLRPYYRDSLKHVEILSEPDPFVSETDSIKEYVYYNTLTRFDSADITIPPITVQYRVVDDTTLYSILSNPVSFTIHRVNVSTEEDIKDIKPPLLIPLNWWMIMLWILIGLILIGLIIYLYKKFFKKLPIEKQLVSKKIKIPAHVEALTKLEKLASEKLWENGQVKLYHSKITEIIRAYFEKRFELPALELTTTESLQQLAAKTEASDILELTGEFLANADLVKFAKFQPVPKVNEEMMLQAKQIVNDTIPVKETTKEVTDVQ